MNLFGLGALFMLLGVGMGAFGAHAVRDRVDAMMYEAFKTGAMYQLVHGLAICFVGAAHGLSGRARKTAAIFFASGILLFSGSLYLLALTGNGKFGMITPFGGILFLLGWGSLVYAGMKKPVSS